MENIVKLPVKNSTRRYKMLTIKKQRKLACQVNGEWIIDATCTSINEMLEQGVISEDAISGWINTQTFNHH